MEANVVKEITVQKLGHTFAVAVHEGGSVTCAIDGKFVAVDALVDGNVKFEEKQKIVVNGTLVGIGGLNLSESEFATLKKAQEEMPSASSQIQEPEGTEKETEEEAATETIEAGESSDPAMETQEENPAAENNAEEEYWQERWEGRKVALKRVDSWKRTVRTYREKDKKGQKYCIHDFRIGNNKYRFVERQLSGTGVVINPDYKILDDIPRIGGVPKQYGELMFWDYLFEDKGWQRVRVLTYNEGICLDIIQNYGYFAFPRDKEKLMKNKNSFFKKLTNKKTAKEKESGEKKELPSAENVE